MLTGSLFLLTGVFFIVVASLGVWRLPDLFTRMHAATKAGTVGLSMLLLAVAIALPDSTVVSRVLGTMLFIFLTAPVAAHMLGKAVRGQGYVIWRNDKKRD